MGIRDLHTSNEFQEFCALSNVTRSTVSELVLIFLDEHKPLKLRSVASVHWPAYWDFSLFKRSQRYCANYLSTEMFSLLSRPTLYEISFVCVRTAKFVIPEHTPSFLHLRRHFPQMRDSSHKRQDLENQAATFQNLNHQIPVLVISRTILL